MYYLNWKYTARDHTKLFEVKLIEVLTGQIKSIIASSWLTSSKEKELDSIGSNSA